MRIQVKIDISKPLCRGRKAMLASGKEIWISFKYERLPNLCYWCGMLTHGDRDCDRWLRSKGTLRREEQQYGAWLRAGVDRPIRRVKVKVAGRSNIPRWGRGVDRSPVVNSLGASPHGGDAVSEVGETIMDFTKLKKNLPQFSKFPKQTSDSTKQNLHEINDDLKLPSNPVDTGDTIESTEARESRDEIQSMQSVPLMETIQVGGTCSPPSQHQSNLDTKTSEVQSRNFFKDITNDLTKTCVKQIRKKKDVGGVQIVPDGKENVKGGKDLDGMHEVVVQGESRGMWKRISRDVLVVVSPGSHPSLLGIK